MNTKLTKRSICALALGSCTVFASALSLGPLTGSTIVGRPLALTAPIQFDALAQGNGSGCVSADVLYGDKRVDSARVQVDLTPDTAGQVSYARISSASVVDEPFVTLVLRAGCGRQTTRRYVLLADAPKDEPMILGATSSLALARAAPVESVKPPAGSAAPARTTRVAAVASPQPSPVVRRVTAAAGGDPGAQGGRLQLAVWDPNAQQLPWLRASTELRSLPSVDAAHRAAATALWRALNAQPQDLFRTAERLRGLEAEMGSLRGLADRHRSELVSARESLQNAQSRRHVNLVVATLVALLAGGGAAFFWHRTRRADARVSSDGWHGPIEPWGGAGVVVEEERKPLPAPLGQVVAEPADLVQPQPVVTLKEPAARVSQRAPAARPPRSPFEFTLPEATPPLPAAPVHGEGGFKVDALHGAQQQSEFFASLGQVDEAVAVLSSYLEESSETPVLAFLELFRIYHGTGMRVEYEELQSTFRRTFGMDVMSFGQYKEEHRELELYLVPVTRIASAWPSERSQELIEELLFKRPATTKDLLSLEAYRELLWLYSLGQEIVDSTGLPVGLQLLGDRGLPNDHFILPWAVGEPEDPAELSLARLTRIDVAPELNAFGVDIDLTAMRSAAPSQSRPEARHAPEPTTRMPPHDSSGMDAFDAVMESESRRHNR